MAAHLTWLVATWLDAGLPLFAFPHHWLDRANTRLGTHVCRRGATATNSSSIVTDKARDESLRDFVESYKLAVLPPVVERAFGSESASSRHARLERDHIARVTTRDLGRHVYYVDAALQRPRGCPSCSAAGSRSRSSRAAAGPPLGDAPRTARDLPAQRATPRRCE